MPTSKGKKLIKITLNVFVGLLFAVATLYSVLTAYGYKIDFLKIDVFKTSIIDFVGDYSNINLYIDGSKISEKLPFQFKDVRPGVYNLEIKSDKFLDWNKKIEVLEDIVTIVNDIYLVPVDLGSFKIFNELNLSYSDVVLVGQNAVFVSEDRAELKILNLENSNNIDFKVVNSLNEIYYKNIYSLGDKYLVFENNEEINLLDIESLKFMEILVPDEFLNFKLAYSNGIYGFYMKEGSLFSSLINEDGSFYNVKLVYDSPKFKKFDIFCRGNLVLIKTENVLYEYNGDVFDVLAEDIKYGPYISPYGNKVVYINGDGQIYMYSTQKDESSLIGAFDGEVNYIDWFFDSRHLLILQGNKLVLCDFTMENCPVIESEVLTANIFASKTKPLIVLLYKEGFNVIDFALK